MSKLGELAKKLAAKPNELNDPFDDNYFDRKEYESRRLKEEPDIIEAALNKAKKKQDFEQEKRKCAVFTRNIKERYWE